MSAFEELRALYLDLYGDTERFEDLLAGMNRFRKERSDALKARDEAKGGTEWYKSGEMLHMMPFLDTVHERSDGGYAAADFRKVRPDLGTMEDLEALRKDSKAFSAQADFWTFDTGSDAVLGLGRWLEDEGVIGLFNFADESKTISLDDRAVTVSAGDYLWIFC